MRPCPWAVRMANCGGTGGRSGSKKTRYIKMVNIFEPTPLICHFAAVNTGHSNFAKKIFTLNLQCGIMK